jgi:hypothetical protein
LAIWTFLFRSEPYENSKTVDFLGESFFWFSFTIQFYHARSIGHAARRASGMSAAFANVASDMRRAASTLRSASSPLFFPALLS